MDAEKGIQPLFRVVQYFFLEILMWCLTWKLKYKSQEGGKRKDNSVRKKSLKKLLKA